jgi:hypothetical protein
MNFPGGACWANSLGECEGPITAEHLATGALFQRRVRIKGDGAPWLPSPDFELSIDRLKANILCRRHNEQLGRTADAAALRLHRALRQTNNPTQLPGARGPLPPKERRISGHHLGQWLCKTHCNFMIAAGLSPAADFVKYAFGRPTERPIYFLFAVALGDTVRFGHSQEPVVGYTQLLQDDTPGYDGCVIRLSGLPMIISNARVIRNNQQMIDRLRMITQPSALGDFRICLDWRGEPAYISKDA